MHIVKSHLKSLPEAEQEPQTLAQWEHCQCSCSDTSEPLLEAHARPAAWRADLIIGQALEHLHSFLLEGLRVRAWLQWPQTLLPPGLLPLNWLSAITPESACNAEVPLSQCFVHSYPAQQGAQREPSPRSLFPLSSSARECRRAIGCGARPSPKLCSPLVCKNKEESSDRMLVGLARVSEVCGAERLSAQLKSSGSRLARRPLLSWRCRPPPGTLSTGELCRASRCSDTMDDKGVRFIQAWPEAPGASLGLGWQGSHQDAGS